MRRFCELLIQQNHAGYAVAEAAAAAPALATVAARPGATAASASRRLEAAVGAAARPQLARARGEQRAPWQASPPLPVHAPAAAGAPHHPARCRRSARARVDVRARPPLARAVLAGCAERRERPLRGAREHDVERLRRCVPLAGARVRCVDSTSTKSRGALWPRDIAVRLALSLSVYTAIVRVIFTCVSVVCMW